jgi:2-polyprenyl-6-methoxyphenol hydroxylase-like FAD-dependent oxidoreductase
MTFGANGFFGYGAYSPSDSQMMWWSTYETADVPSNEAIDFEGIRHQLRDRHGSWKDPVIRRVINCVKVDSIYPTWTTPELPKWGDGRIFIVGDAAHALQPTSGQGTSQAFEDVQTLTLLLTHYMQSGGSECVVEQNTFRSMQNLYYAIRKPRIAALVQYTSKFANRKRNQGFLAEWLMYFFIWLMGKLPTFTMARLFEFDKWDAHKEVEKALANEESKVIKG